MKIAVTDSQIRAMLSEVLSRGNPPMPDFLNWIADRLVEHHGDDAQVDFVQTLRRYARDMEVIRNALKTGDVSI